MPSSKVGKFKAPRSKDFPKHEADIFTEVAALTKPLDMSGFLVMTGVRTEIRSSSRNADAYLQITMAPLRLPPEVCFTIDKGLPVKVECSKIKSGRKFKLETFDLSTALQKGDVDGFRRLIKKYGAFSKHFDALIEDGNLMLNLGGLRGQNASGGARIISKIDGQLPRRQLFDADSFYAACRVAQKHNGSMHYSLKGAILFTFQAPFGMVDVSLPSAVG
jgi:hypothetical protein